MSSEKSTEELQKMLDELTIKFVQSSSEAEKKQYRDEIADLLQLCKECKL